MSRGLIALSILLFIAQVDCRPLSNLRRFTKSHTTNLTLKTERTWLWGWAWGAESTVSVVDRFPPVSFPSKPAGFGAELTEPLLGYVIPLSSFTVPCQSSVVEDRPNLGCPKLCVDGSHEPQRAETWVALVQRGHCEFVEKVREAQRLGANAVVVGGNDPGLFGNPDTLINMYSPGDSSDVTISATYIRYSDYMELSGLISTSNTSHNGLQTVSLMISSEVSVWDWYSPIITFIVILLLPSSLTFITLLVHRIRASRAARRDRAPEDFVHSLPSRTWTGHGWEKEQTAFSGSENVKKDPANQPEGVSEEGDPSTSQGCHPATDPPWFESQVECAICLSDFAIGDRVRVLPCCHIFHIDEVDEWLIHRKKLCPVCKADVTKPVNVFNGQLPINNEGADTDAAESHSRPATERTPLISSPSEPEAGS